MTRTNGIWAKLAIALGAAAIVGGPYWFFEMPVGNTLDSLPSIVATGTSQEGIPAIDQPTFESATAADQYLHDDGEGIAVEVDGEHRFYPYQILVWHEVVNDVFNGKSIVISYGPFSGAGMAFERESSGVERTFGPSGSVVDNGLILIDRGGKGEWNQLTGLPIDFQSVESSLVPIPTGVMRWSVWKREYPRGEVLSRETGWSRDYTRNPYGNYARTPEVWFPVSTIDARLPAKTRVYFIALGEDRFAVSEETLLRMKRIQEKLDGQPVEIQWDENAESARAYRIAEDGSEINLPITRAFWFAVASAFPGIRMYELP